MEMMAKDISEMKTCNALARQSQLSLTELRGIVKPATEEEDAKVSEMFRDGVAARLRCGLMPSTK